MSKQYRHGYEVESRCRELLRERGAVVVRSAGSKGLADLVAIFPEKKEIWLVQVKKAEAPRDLSKLKEKFRGLASLSGTYTCKPVLFMKVGGKYSFIPLG